jgi:hypothetical protein
MWDAILGQFSTSDGSYSASSRFGGSTPAGTSSIFAIANPLVDASGAVIVKGISFCDTTAAPACTQINYGLGLANPGGGSGSDGFVGRYVVNTGVPTWLAVLRGPGDDRIDPLAPGPSGTVFVGGNYNEGATASASLVSGSNVMSFPGTGTGAFFVAQLNPTTGAIGMTKSFASTTNASIQTLAWTGSELIAAGSYKDASFDFGVRSLSPVGGGDIWIAKLSQTDGSARWAVPIATTGTDKYPYVTVDGAGDVYVCGTIGGPITLGGFAVGAAGGQDVFVAKLRNADGSVVWAKSFGSTLDDSSTGIAVSSGRVAVAADVQGPIQTGGTAPGAQDIAIATFATSDGTLMWTKMFGTSSTDYSFGVSGGTNGFYVAFDPGADVGPTLEGVPISGAAAPAGVLVKIQP